MTLSTMNLERIEELAALWSAENDDRRLSWPAYIISNSETFNRTTAARNAFNRAKVETAGSVSAEKLRTTFLALVATADDDTGETDIGIARLSERTGIPERTVKRALAVLTDYGWVTVTLAGVKGKSNARRAVHWGMHIAPDPSRRMVNARLATQRNRFLFSDDVRETNKVAAAAMVAMAESLPEPPAYRASGDYFDAAAWNQGEPPF